MIGLLALTVFILVTWGVFILGESIELRIKNKLGFPPDPKDRWLISGNIFVILGWILVALFVFVLLFFIAAVAWGQELPAHDPDSHTAQHYPMLTNPLFPESEAVRLEREWMIGPCACGCGLPVLSTHASTSSPS